MKYRMESLTDDNFPAWIGHAETTDLVSCVQTLSAQTMFGGPSLALDGTAARVAQAASATMG